MPAVYPEPKDGILPSPIMDTKIKSITEVMRDAVLGLEELPDATADVSTTEDIAIPENSYNENSTSTKVAPALFADAVVLVVVGIAAELAE